MSNRYARILTAGGAAVLLAALETPAALAAATANTWTVQPGGGIKAAAGSLTLTDTTSSGVSDRCTSATMSGTLKAGSGLPGSGIGSISKAAYRGCGILGSRDLAPRGLPWHLNLLSYDAATGVSRGTISHLRIAFSIPGCSAVVNGTSGSASDGVVPVTYANQTGKLKILPHGGTLHWYHVRGCAGLVHNGDTATLSATFAVSPRQDITSP